MLAEMTDGSRSDRKVTSRGTRTRNEVDGTVNADRSLSERGVCSFGDAAAFGTSFMNSRKRVISMAVLCRDEQLQRVRAISKRKIPAPVPSDPLN